MNLIYFWISPSLLKTESVFIETLQAALKVKGYVLRLYSDKEPFFSDVQRAERLAAVLFDWDHFQCDVGDFFSNFNPHLPLLAISRQHEGIDVKLSAFDVNIEFVVCDDDRVAEYAQHIQHRIETYMNDLLPPFTRALFHFAEADEYTFCTPGHMGGTAFLRSPSGALFYDFYGENVFKADLSVSMTSLGSLLDHTGPHRDAEALAAKVFGSDKTFFVTNGTSTSNKIVGMYSASDGDTVLVDRNCHKSLTHLLMILDVKPIYLKPTRNALGIIGGIPRSEFLPASIQQKLDASHFTHDAPVYAVITNSTYDGLLYNVEAINQVLTVKHLHFDSAWVPYVNCHPIYRGKYAMDLPAQANKTLYETTSSHKLLAAFSQASMIHIKGEYDFDTFNECFMMHTSTSPQYGIVASCEIAAKMLEAPMGERLIQSSIDEAVSFRKEIKRLKSESKTWFFDVWQPDDVDTPDCWPLSPGESWHGFDGLDPDHLYLDPIKVTLTLPGIEDARLVDEGIPAVLVSAFLDDQGIVVEKTGPYTLLFLFSMGITRDKSMALLKALVDFKRVYDADGLVEEVLPSLYRAHPDFYKEKTLQFIAKELHSVAKEYHLPALMFKAFEYLPEQVLTPHQAYCQLVKGNTELVELKDLMGRTAAVMILPYPPGIPLIMPGEKITQDSRAVLDYLLMLEAMGELCPGFEADIHGIVNHDGSLKVKCIRE